MYLHCINLCTAFKFRKVNSPEVETTLQVHSSQVETALQVHSSQVETGLQLYPHNWRQFDPACVHAKLYFQKLLPTVCANNMYPYPQLSLQSIDFSLSLSGLLLSLDNTSIHLYSEHGDAIICCHLILPKWYHSHGSFGLTPIILQAIGKDKYIIGM